jgi:hypothetical protein
MASAIVQVGLSAVKDHTHTHTRVHKSTTKYLNLEGDLRIAWLDRQVNVYTHTQQCLIFIDEALFLRSTAMRFGPAHDKSKEEKCPETR